MRRTSRGATPRRSASTAAGTRPAGSAGSSAACELELREAIPLGHTLRVSTAVVGHRRIWARRLGECRLADGRIAAVVTTDWVLLDGRGRIARIPPDFGVAFTNPEIGAEIIRVPAMETDRSRSLDLTVRPRRSRSARLT